MSSSTTEVLNSAEAAARLGVKVETLYAYVSRGVLHRAVADDGRTSRFDRREIEALRASRSRRAAGEVGAVVTSSVTRVGDDGFWYRGVPVTDSVAAGEPFEAVAERLWRSPEPAPGGAWAVDPEVLDSVRRVQDELPPAAPGIDRLRAVVVTVSAADEMRADLAPPAVRAAGRRLLGAFVDGLPGPSARRGRLADRLWPHLTRRRSTPAARDALNAALVLVADHDLAASTYAARVAASTRADPYAVVQSGLGALGGPLHGAASRDTHDMVARALEVGSARALGEILARGRRVPGFGHKVYTGGDPRYADLVTACRGAFDDTRTWAVVEEIEALGAERSGGRRPNIDLAIGTFTVLAGMAPTAGETIFAVARTAGWLAHALEEYEEPPLRYRPQSRYTGPRPGATTRTSDH